MTVEWQRYAVDIFFELPKPESSFFCTDFKGLACQTTQRHNPFPALQPLVLEGYREYHRKDPMIVIRCSAALFEA